MDPRPFLMEEGARMIRQQVERQTHHQSRTSGETVETAERVPDVEDLKAELDEILDEIDELLEENAEEFVKGYVQKGGE
jgi:ubiquitin-like protein Pup